MGEAAHIKMLANRNAELSAEVNDLYAKYNRAQWERDRALLELKIIDSSFWSRVQVLFMGIRVWWWKK